MLVTSHMSEIFVLNQFLMNQVADLIAGTAKGQSESSQVHIIDSRVLYM